MIGTLLSKRFRIVQQLGEGGMGSIYEADDLTAERKVAIKVIARELLDRGSFVKRFHREAAAAVAIDSPHIAPVFESGIDDETGTPFIAMERLTGMDLGALLRRAHEISSDLALRIVAQTCLGLQKAHAASVVHRDIKPSNLFLASDGHGGITVKLLDFGIAKLLADHSGGVEGSLVLTQTGAVLGSPLYLSPEQARGSADIDHRADIWSLGVVLYQALTGHPPKVAVDGIGTLIVAICTEPARPVQEVAPWVSPSVATIVHTALALRREARFQTAGEMHETIMALLPNGAEIREDMLVPLSAKERNAVVADRTPPKDETTAVETGSGAEPARAARGVRRTATATPTTSGARVLIIEDNAMNMDMLSRRLTRKGYQVLQAVDGETGIALACAERPALILMDMSLPVMDGWAAVTALRAAPETSKTPIIALTGHAGREDRDRAIQVGCNDFETKPLDLARLIGKIEALLSGPKAP